MCLTLATPAAAQPVFYIDHGTWVVTATRPGICVAISRPAVDYNISPFNSLEFSLRAEDPGLQVTANFWPGAFGPDAAVTLSLSSGASVQEIPAQSRDGYAAVAVAGLSREAFRALRRAGTITVRAEGVDHAVGAEMRPSLTVLQSELRSCVELTGGG